GNVVRHPSRRRDFPIEIGRILAAWNICYSGDGDGGLIKPDETCWLTRKHFRAFKGKRTSTRVGFLATRELVARHVVGVRPDTNLRIVVKNGRTLIKLIGVVGSARIGARRNRNALGVAWCRARNELANE